MSDYYDPQPRLILRRPIVLAGQIGSGARLIGRTLSARTGLPFVEVDRSIEHEAGRSLARIAAEDGRIRIERWAQSILGRLKSSRPFAVLVLDHAWPTLAVRDDLCRRTDFIHIQRPSAFLEKRLPVEVRRSGDWLLGDFAAEILEKGALQGLRDQRTPLLTQASILLEAGEQHEHRMSEILMEWLEPAAGSRPG